MDIQEEQLGVKLGKTAEDENVSKDKFYFVLITLFFLGTVSVLPLTFFTTANEYWMYKFRNTTFDHDDPNNRTFLQKNFATLQAFAVLAPMVFVYILSIFVGHTVKAQTRVIIFLVPVVLVLSFQTVLVKIDTDDYQLTFFLMTSISLVVISVAMSIGSVGCITLATCFPTNYVKCFLVSQGLAGIFTSTIRIMSIISSSSVIDAGFIYFVVGSTTMGLACVLFVVASQTAFFRHYMRAAKPQVTKKINSFKDIFRIFNIIYLIIGLNVILAIFPVLSIANLVVSEFKDTDNVWGDKYFVTVATYFIPAVCDIVGRLTSNIFDRDFSIWFLYVLSTVRTAILSPMLFFSNALPRTRTPVIFGNDWEYILIMAATYFTQSYFGNVIMLKMIRSVPKDKLDLTFSVNMFFTGTITAVGTLFGIIIVALL
ncbi:equilibrative nucleoside transporter 3-like [Cylas formicarius]|uniref:equilibrative nucleoside transporter 3-like n=1 Tax=Cylas formicarius TaxID=197179 RepID=UPI0029589793|nr:equilibrative nucleoside transporter 3-like [Cylas formicarius]